MRYLLILWIVDISAKRKKNNQKSTGLTQIEAKSNTRALFVRVLDGYRFF